MLARPNVLLDLTRDEELEVLGRMDAGRGQDEREGAIHGCSARMFGLITDAELPAWLQTAHLLTQQKASTADAVCTAARLGCLWPFLGLQTMPSATALCQVVCRSRERRPSS